MVDGRWQIEDGSEEALRPISPFLIPPLQYSLTPPLRFPSGPPSPILCSLTTAY